MGIRLILSKAAFVSFLIALSAAVLAIGSGLGSRLEWWHFGTGFMLLKWSVYGAIVAVVLALVGLIAGGKRVLLRSLLALVIALPLILVPVGWLNSARSVPAIHDITTDTINPPKFDAALTARHNATNTLEYGGESIAEQQKAAYPDIQPIIIDALPQEAYAVALRAARELGWDIVAQKAEQGRIEAVDTTFWFGFKDDVVVRIVAHDNGSRVDVRSVSRVGRSDVGTNAARIRKFMAKIEKH